MPEAVRERAGLPMVVINRIEIPTRTIVKVLLTLAVLWFLFRIHGILIELFVAALLAAAMSPPVNALRRRGWPRSLAVIAVVVGVLAIFAAAIFLIAQPLVNEGKQLANDLPGYIDQTQRFFQNNPALYKRIQDAASSGSTSPSTFFNGVLNAGTGIISGISAAFIVIILAVYILLEGGRALNWLTRDLSSSHRHRLDRLMPELVRVVSGYIIGQLITSTLFGVFTFIVLTILGVPQPLLLALLAAFADAIPILGVPLAILPAALLGLTVSLQTAVIVVIAYVIYQQIENYVLVPRVYQGTLQISSFAVLIAVLIGTTLLGILGALLALPIAAAIPVVERVWLGQEIPEGVAHAVGDVTEDSEIGEAAEENADAAPQIPQTPRIGAGRR